MMKSVTIFRDSQSMRSIVTARALADGFRKLGASVRITNSQTEKPETAIAAGYGWKWYPSFKNFQHYFYVDLGWWLRKPDINRFTGYSRITHNQRFELPINPFEHENLKFDGKRWKRFKADLIQMKPAPEKGARRTVLLAGMSDKSAITFGYQPGEWEEGVAYRLMSECHTVLYRPKVVASTAHLPRHKIEGTKEVVYETLDELFGQVDCVVSHHSNVSVEALAAGLPAYCAAMPVHPFYASMVDLLENCAPKDPGPYLQQLSYRQWTMDEMKTGMWLQHYGVKL